LCLVYSQFRSYGNSNSTFYEISTLHYSSVLVTVFSRVDSGLANDPRHLPLDS
jgi:hypothetical protein